VELNILNKKRRTKSSHWTNSEMDYLDGSIWMDVSVGTNVPPPSMQDAATRCNTLQHAATRCNALQHAATRCNTLHHAATCYNMLQRAATRCNTC